MINRHHPRYNDDADFTTNAPSYYEDLARKEKLIRMLAERIWGYEKILDETLEQIQERFRAWDKNLEDFPEDVKTLLQQWLDDGTLDHIINDTIFNWKLDTTIFEQFRDSIDSFAVFVESYPRLAVEIEDSSRLQRAVNTVSAKGGGTVFLGNRTYDLVNTIMLPSNVTIQGVGRRGTTLNQLTNNIPIIDIGFGQFKGIRKMTLKYANKQGVADVNANAITKNSTAGALGQSVIEELEFINVGRAIDTANAFYSNSVRDIWVQGYAHGVFHFAGTGNTGNVLTNIYSTNWDNYTNRTKNKANIAFFFAGFTESVVTQINIEHTRLNYGIYIQTTDNFVLDSVHYEGYEQVGLYNGLLAMQYATAHVTGLTVCFSWVDVSSALNTELNLFSLKGGSVLKAQGVTTRNNAEIGGNKLTTSGITTRLLYAAGKENSSVITEHISKDGLMSSYPIPTVNSVPPVLKNYNQRVFYQEQPNGRIIMTSETLPTIGKWYKGDKIYNSKADIGGYEGWICVGTGDYSKQNTNTLATTTPYLGSIVVSNSNIPNGTRIDIDGGGTYTTTTAAYDSGGGVLKQNISPSMSNHTLTNVSVHYSAPLFKGFGLIES